MVLHDTDTNDQEPFALILTGATFFFRKLLPAFVEDEKGTKVPKILSLLLQVRIQSGHYLLGLQFRAEYTGIPFAPTRIVSASQCDATYCKPKPVTVLAPLTSIEPTSSISRQQQREHLVHCRLRSRASASRQSRYPLSIATSGHRAPGAGDRPMFRCPPRCASRFSPPGTEDVLPA